MKPVGFEVLVVLYASSIQVGLLIGDSTTPIVASSLTCSCDFNITLTRCASELTDTAQIGFLTEVGISLLH